MIWEDESRKENIQKKRRGKQKKREQVGGKSGNWAVQYLVFSLVQTGNLLCLAVLV